MSVVGKRSGFEYLWQGDPALWAGRAMVLFPICGRLLDDRYTWQGNTYEMPLRGFAQYETFAVTAQSDASVTFELRDNKNTHIYYPFCFVFRVIYSLDGGRLTCRYEVENPGEEILPLVFPRIQK